MTKERQHTKKFKEENLPDEKKRNIEGVETHPKIISELFVLF